MRTAFQIFKRDLKRILANPVAIVIAIGVAIIPSLYAWFNILANWDPYENTSTVPIAVVIEDRGADVGDMGTINAGDMIEEQLKENTQLGWTFVDDEQAALDGVNAGRYYAAFVVPEDFTSSLGDVLSGDTDQAHIAYYVNEKLNAISPKVTDTGSTTLETEIANKFVGVVGKTITEKLQGLSTSLMAESDAATATLSSDLSQVQVLLTNLSGDLSGAQKTIADARQTVADARTTLSQVSSSATSLSDALSQSMDTLGATRTKAQTLGAQLSGALGTGVSTISGISAEANHSIGEICGDIGWAQGQLDGAISQVGALNDNTFASMRSSLEQAQAKVSALPDTVPNKQQMLASIQQALDAIDELRSATSGKIEQLKGVSGSIKETNDAVSGLSTSVNDAVQSSAQGLSSLQGSLASTTLPALSNSLDSFADAGGRLVGLSSAVAPMLSQVDGALAQLDGVLSQSTDALSQTADAVSGAADKVGGLATDAAAIQSAETFSILQDVLGLDAEQVGDFMGSPVDMVSSPIYPVANYGSGVAPFYTNLALWVGGFVLVAIYKLEVD
ncbi:YhgE/Pip family protein, partial [Parolsenella catena]|uniref:YhgE/Pip family protein n=1 Tax=Parolsenella catena TaxID=2003188 RepID=UPI003AEF7EBA